MVPMIKQFDTNGEPIRVNGVKHTVKDYASQTYETPYGTVQVQCHIIRRPQEKLKEIIVQPKSMCYCMFGSCPRNLRMRSRGLWFGITAAGIMKRLATLRLIICTMTGEKKSWKSKNNS